MTVYFAIPGLLVLVLVATLRDVHQKSSKVAIILLAVLFSCLGVVAELPRSTDYAVAQRHILSAQDAYYEAMALNPEIPAFTDPSVGSVGVGGDDSLGELQGNAPFGWYGLTLSCRQAIVIETAAANGNDRLDTILELFTEQGQLLASNDDIDGGINLYSRIEQVVNPGNYILRVRGWGGDTGAYKLRVLPGEPVVC